MLHEDTLEELLVGVAVVAGRVVARLPKDSALAHAGDDSVDGLLSLREVRGVAGGSVENTKTGDDDALMVFCQRIAWGITRAG